MKKFKFLILLIIFVLMTPIKAYASGGISVYPTSLSITKGGSTTFTISASNAVGRVDIYSSNGSVASVNRSSEWLENSSVTVTVTGVSGGSATIYVSLSDAATFDEEELSGTYSIYVNVSEPVSETPQESNNTQPNNGGSNNNNTNNNNNSTPVDDGKSKNNNLKSLSVDGYELTKIDNNNYELTVTNEVTSIKINAVSEDSKSKVSGTGAHEINVGENNIEVTVTAENGSQNKINIKVIRKDGYYFEDLDNVLKNDNLNNIAITVNGDNKITSEVLKSIKDSKKEVSFNFYDEEKKLLYSWSFNGKKMSETKEFNTNIIFESGLVKEIGKASNYAEGKYIHFEHSGNLPSGTKVKLYVGDKFEDNSSVNVYYYLEKNKELQTIKKNLIVKDGYIEFDIDHCSDYFVTMSSVKTQEPTTNIFFILFIVVSILLLIVLILDFLKINPISKLTKDKDNKINKVNKEKL